MASSSFIQTANSTTADAANQQGNRRLYAITRSESTWLIDTYKTALQKGEAIGMEPYRLFRDALENKKPAYLGKFNNSHNTVVRGTFYAMATHLFTVIQKLFARVENDHHHTKVKNLCKDLPTDYTNAYASISNLNWAVYNRHYYHGKNIHIIEELSDNCFENNSCAVCDFTGDGTYYFSTTYGVEKPICENCLPVDDVDVDTKNDSEYVVSEEEEESDGEPSGDEEEDEEVSEEDDDENDPDYVPDEEDDEDDDEDEDEDEDDNEDEDEDEDKEKFFGCAGCPYEWRAGFKYGWQKAMKHMRDYANQQKHDVPAAPECALCKDSHEDLQTCDRCKLVRYCSAKCQSEDWAEHKDVCCRR